LRFNDAPGQNVLRLGWIDRDGETSFPALSDPAAAATLQGFAANPSPAPVSEFLTIDGEEVFRTVYPAIANGAVFGALTVDLPVGPFLNGIYRDCIVIATFIFGVIGGVGLWITVGYYHQNLEREAAREQAETANRAK